MDRKYFISSLLPLAACLGKLRARPFEPATASGKSLSPPYLSNGSTVSITCPAGFISEEDIGPAVLKLKEWGFRIKIGSTVGKKDFGFGGTDAERLQDLQAQLDDPEVNAILFARGGYGAVRIIDNIDFTGFLKNPKWLIGFSDITVLHTHINSRFNIATLHSKMCNSFPSDWGAAEPIQRVTIESIGMCLKGEPMKYDAPLSTYNKTGISTGPLVGGNLRTIENLAGTSSDLDTKNKILFVEDTGEYLYSIDRMFWNLKRTGKLSFLKGLIIGGFKIKPDDPGEEFGRSLEQIVLEKVAEFDYPVCFGFPVGHQKNNYALKCNAEHTLKVSSTGTSLVSV